MTAPAGGFGTAFGRRALFDSRASSYIGTSETWVWAAPSIRPRIHNFVSYLRPGLASNTDQKSRSRHHRTSTNGLTHIATSPRNLACQCLAPGR